jgi:hypothetical protein
MKLRSLMHVAFALALSACTSQGGTPDDAGNDTANPPDAAGDTGTQFDTSIDTAMQPDTSADTATLPDATGDTEIGEGGDASPDTDGCDAAAPFGCLRLTPGGFCDDTGNGPAPVCSSGTWNCPVGSVRLEQCPCGVPPSCDGGPPRDAARD